MMIEFANLKTLLPYFDVPLQHINDSLLQSMNRKVSKTEIISKINFLRELFPDCAIRTTFITGFPGETRQQYEELKAFIKEFNFTRLGVFTYSDEIGTPSYMFDNKVSKRTAQNRKDKIMSIQQEISHEVLSSYIGKSLDVIIDRKAQDKQFDYEGRSFLDAPDIDGVVFIHGNKCNIGGIMRVKIIEAWEYDLVGMLDETPMPLI
jgi:ribosomal protein S12 methylthiotransferase